MYKRQVFSSAAEFLESEKPDAPACLILDLQLPGTSGLDLQQQLAAADAPPIVFISGHGDIPSSVRAMKAGAIEFLSKPIGERELLDAIDDAIARDRVARQKRLELADLQRHYEHLTPREREVLPFVVAGFANKVTAADLGTSEITIGVHRGQIMRKTVSYTHLDVYKRQIFHLVISILISAALAILGPGAYSVDARIFGRKLLTVPSRHRPDSE